MKQRIMTAVVLMLIFIPLALLGGVPFLILTYAMGTIALYELFRMKKLTIFSVYGILSTCLLWIFLLPASMFEQINPTSFDKSNILYAFVFILLAYTVIVKNKFSFEDVGFSIVSVLYVGIGFYYLFQTRELGITYLLYVLLVIWLTDSGAYFIGGKLGRRKLWPAISPNKTVGGFLGGILSAVLVAIIFLLFTNIDIPPLSLILMTIIISIVGQLGDLVESALKRHFNVKDSGNIFPGHGGILDRCDSWIFVLPLFYFFYSII